MFGSLASRSHASNRTRRCYVCRGGLDKRKYNACNVTLVLMKDDGNRSDGDVTTRDDIEFASIDRIFQSVETVSVSGAPFPDTAPALAAAEYVRAQFNRLGLHGVAVEETPTLHWPAPRHGLRLAGENVPCAFVSPSFAQGRLCSLRTAPKHGQQSSLWRRRPRSQRSTDPQPSSGFADRAAGRHCP